MSDKQTAEVPVDDSLYASDAAAAAFNLQDHLVGLLLTEPFFAELIRSITKVKDKDIPTAGVCVKDNDLYLYWNPKFLANLKAAEVTGLLKHECYHLFFEHCTTRRMEPHRIANVATDLAINSIIPEDELPKCGLIPGKPLDLSKVTDPEHKAKMQKVSDKIASFPKGQSSDWYFSALMEDPEVQDALDSGEGEISISMDDHEGWDEMSEEDREVVRGKVKDILRKAVKRSDSNNSWGSVPSEIREQLRKMASDAVDWKRVLQNFCGTSQRLNKSSTLRRLNRKYPYVHPGVQRGHSATVGVFVDMSGSVTDEALEQIYGVLDGLAKRVTFKFYPFDTEVDEKSGFEWRKGQKKEAIRYRSGGTSFTAVNDFVKKHRGEMDGYLVCTDGMAEDPGPSPIRRAWVLVPGTKLMFKSHSTDIEVFMDTGK
jgi:predicted metal-dependent peptidase